ncbi:hypothetical protein [Adhaeribacter pallidiroseus]|uniref:Lipocalin-like domain-containing protein n=1 Tax=Adhaeribacter pallidiroseus TaxID=2072847 RepID=A0A369QTJ9_9BACT|nr:hypothetical protein [Adhaeribacter pallidiroseus]RDC66149.1 hypothetical protein AHMF7616_04780 [Adhaeribacter pallidiroseus]
MKKLLPFLFLLASCKDDEGVNLPQSATDLLQGSWKISSEFHDYYDATNTKIIQANGGSGMILTFKGQNVELLDTGNKFKGSYTLTETNGRQFLTTSILSNTKTVEVTSLTEVRMTWQTETPNATYFADGLAKTAAKSITIVNLVKPR